MTGKPSEPLAPQDFHDSHKSKPAKESINIKKNNLSPSFVPPPTPAFKSIEETTTPHWSLWETMLTCSTINSISVTVDILKNLKGYHIDNIILEDVAFPNPFPFDLFKEFSFDFLELRNAPSVIFRDNFSANKPKYSHANEKFKINSPTAKLTNSTTN